MDLTCCTGTADSIQPGIIRLHSRWMILRWGICVAMLAAPAMGVTILDVSSETSIVVHTGDSLIFQLLTWNFGVNAARQNLSPDPTDVNFALVSDQLSGAAGFAASVESADGTVAVD